MQILYIDLKRKVLKLKRETENNNRITANIFQGFNGTRLFSLSACITDSHDNPLESILLLFPLFTRLNIMRNQLVCPMSQPIKIILVITINYTCTLKYFHMY